MLAGGVNWGCYGPSLVLVLPQAPRGAQQPPPPSIPYATAMVRKNLAKHFDCFKVTNYQKMVRIFTARYSVR